MAIAAHRSVDGRKQRLKTPRLVILEFILEALPTHLGTPGTQLRMSLAPNYQVAKHQIHHEIVIFEICDDEALAEHAEKVDQLAARLQGEYVFQMQPLPL
jgi:hypothetical protein